jgi:hypothetical protein
VTAPGWSPCGRDRSRIACHVNSRSAARAIAGRTAQTISLIPRSPLGCRTTTERTMAPSPIAQASTAPQNRPTAAGAGRGIRER